MKWSKIMFIVYFAKLFFLLTKQFIFARGARAKFIFSRGARAKCFGLARTPLHICPPGGATLRCHSLNYFLNFRRARLASPISSLHTIPTSCTPDLNNIEMLRTLRSCSGNKTFITALFIIASLHLIT